MTGLLAETVGVRPEDHRGFSYLKTRLNACLYSQVCFDCIKLLYKFKLSLTSCLDILIAPPLRHRDGRNGRPSGKSEGLRRAQEGTPQEVRAQQMQMEGEAADQEQNQTQAEGQEKHEGRHCRPHETQVMNLCVDKYCTTRPRL